MARYHHPRAVTFKIICSSTAIIGLVKDRCTYDFNKQVLRTTKVAPTELILSIPPRTWH